MAQTDPATEAARAKFTGMRKAAMLMVILGEEVSAKLMKGLDEEEVHFIGREIARIPHMNSETAELILEEYYQMTIAHEYVLKGGVDYAKKILMNAFAPDHAQFLLARLMKTIGVDSANFDALQKADPQQLAKFIHSEHPQTVALILSHLNPSQAAALLNSLPSELRADVALRMANLDQISPDIISRIAAIIGQKLKNLGELSRESYGGVRAVAEMFNRLDAASSKEILEKIEGEDPALVETVRHLMFVFEDLLTVDQGAIKEILSRVDRKLLTVALKGASEQLRNHFLDCMSQRGSEMMREDMSSLGPVKIKDVEAAQQQVIAVVRQLENEGVINMKGGGGGEQYVV
ncbi:MAG: flagellar motor switch protein FliG [Acidobacteriota bacterium]|jgi:flagellar motor switch protein FliG|nr:flagellar motor switch protein FliG [Bryobacteraceae bacterium CoA2 C42]MCA2966633.1 flagellar motor switch protein FliG [Acidobacteriaceae bacterium]